MIKRCVLLVYGQHVINVIRSSVGGLNPARIRAADFIGLAAFRQNAARCNFVIERLIVAYSVIRSPGCSLTRLRNTSPVDVVMPGDGRVARFAQRCRSHQPARRKMIGDIPLADAIDDVPAHRLDRRVELDGRDHDARWECCRRDRPVWACAPAHCAAGCRRSYPATALGSGVIWLANGGGVTVGRSGSASSPKSAGAPSSATSRRRADRRQQADERPPAAKSHRRRSRAV